MATTKADPMKSSATYARLVRSPAIARGTRFMIPPQKKESGRRSWRYGLHTFYANTSPFQKPARVFYLLNARNPAVMAFPLFNLLKSGPFEQENKRISIIHPFMGMEILPSAIYTVEQMRRGWRRPTVMACERRGRGSTGSKVFPICPEAADENWRACAAAGGTSQAGRSRIR